MKKALLMMFVAALAVEASATLADEGNRAILTFGYEGAAKDYGIINDGEHPENNDSNGYSGYFCSVETAKTWFGGKTSAADISAYLKNNLASLQSKFTAENGFTALEKVGQTKDSTFVDDQEINYMTLAGEVNTEASGDYVAIAMCARAEGTYYRVFTATYSETYNELVFTGSNEAELGGEPAYANGICSPDASDWKLALAGSNVPEPTSGLLMLLGLAGLALRRKRA